MATASPIAAGRVWAVHAEPHEVGGLAQVVSRAGDLVRRVNEAS